MTGRLWAFAISLCAAFGSASATDGIAVTWACRYSASSSVLVPEREIYSNWDGAYCPGKIIRMDIRNNAVISCDTIYKNTFARFPQMNIDGTKIAFMRFSARLQGGVLVDRDLPLFLSVMDIDGNNVRDLVRLPEQRNMIDWVRDEGGQDWIYYTLGMNTMELWKVKWNDSTTATSVCSYNQNNKADAWWRWEPSADGSRAMVTYHFVDGLYSNFPHVLPFTAPPFPPREGGTADQSAGSCNGTISPSGRFVAGFISHSFSSVQRWDPGTFPWGNNVTINASLAEATDKLGENAGHAMEIHRWSANSDKWICQGATGMYQTFADGGNQVLANWVDKEFIMTTHNEYNNLNDVPIVYYCPMGDFWVAGGPQGCYEDSTGAWISVENGQAVSARSPRSMHQGSPQVAVRPRVVRTDAGIAVALPERGPHYIELFGTNGRCVRSIRTAGETVTMAEFDIQRGVAFIRIVSACTGRTDILRLAK